ncbi:MAG: ion transporter [Granulosicoccaceae bacterium]
MNTESINRRLSALANNRLFEWTAVSVIIASALLLGAKTFEISPATTQLLEWLDFGITVFFVLEIGLRFLACEDKKRFLADPWNLFDTIIVTVSLMPVPSGDQALIARLIRVFRVLRMVSIIPELRILLNSLIKALPQLGYVILLMFIIFYIYAAVGTTLFEHINPTLWGDIAVSLLTLFRVMTFEDWTDVMYETMAVYPLSWAFYLSFIFFTAFAFLNMVIGIVVNVLDQEQAKASAREHPEEPTIASLQDEIMGLKALILEQQGKRN